MSEFLAGKRRLSLSQIGAVRKALRIPADLLIETHLELDEPMRPAAAAEPVSVPPAELRAEHYAEFEALLAAQRDFIVRLNKLLDKATRSMGRRR